MCLEQTTDGYPIRLLCCLLCCDLGLFWLYAEGLGIEINNQACVTGLLHAVHQLGAMLYCCMSVMRPKIA